MIGILSAWVLTVLFLLMTVLPLVRSDFWTFRILEYPRLQKLAIGVVAIVLLIVFRAELGKPFPFLLGASALACSFLIYRIFPYTALAPKEMLRVAEDSKGAGLKIFTANVLQTNRAYDRMLAQVRQMDPDLVFLVETDPGWAEGMKALEADYPHQLRKPLDNTYGLLFYSRLPLRNARVLYRADPEVPSVLTEVQLPNGVWIKAYGLHPKPPVPGESMRSTAKDKELMKVAFEVEQDPQPCIVMGDLNDVAWSFVTSLFRKISGLLDPRRGRGFYSTFSANHKLMRFPLDYIFCSRQFGLVRMQRMPHNGSDHFAMFIHLQYNAALGRIQEEPEADAAEHREAAKKAEKPLPAEPRSERQ